MADRKTPETAVEVCRRRRLEVLNVRGYIGLALRLAVIILAVVIIFSQVFILSQCEGMGMFPAIEDGDLILGYRLQEDFQKGDVVIYAYGDVICIGRIVGFGGDMIQMSDSGSLLINGSTQGGEIMYPTYAKDGIEYPYRVPEGCLFLLGDYRTQTRDSRDFGSIPLDDILGKVITIVRRRGV